MRHSVHQRQPKVTEGDIRSRTHRPHPERPGLHPGLTPAGRTCRRCRSHPV